LKGSAALAKFFPSVADITEARDTAGRRRAVVRHRSTSSIMVDLKRVFKCQWARLVSKDVLKDEVIRKSPLVQVNLAAKGDEVLLAGSGDAEQARHSPNLTEIFINEYIVKFMTRLLVRCGKTVFAKKMTNYIQNNFLTHLVNFTPGFRSDKADRGM
jgi:hypothetical protein